MNRYAPIDFPPNCVVSLCGSSGFGGLGGVGFVCKISSAFQLRHEMNSDELLRDALKVRSFLCSENCSSCRRVSKFKLAISNDGSILGDINKLNYGQRAGGGSENAGRIFSMVIGLTGQLPCHFRTNRTRSIRRLILRIFTNKSLKAISLIENWKVPQMN